MTNVIYAVAVLGILGAFFGAVLAYAAKKFAVETDERQQLVSEALPGANCGGCGYAGCAAYAAAIVKDGAPVNLCVAGGKQVADAISQIMGVETAEMERHIAHVRCSGAPEWPGRSLNTTAYPTAWPQCAWEAASRVAPPPVLDWAPASRPASSTPYT